MSATGDSGPQGESQRLVCPECGSARIVCEREAIIAAPVVGLRDGILVLDGPLVAQPLDDALLACAEWPRSTAWPLSTSLQLRRRDQ